MSAEAVIKVDGVAKKYCRNLKRSMLYGVSDIARNSLGFSSRSHRLRPAEFWALDDISFEVRPGETFGVIGRNGSGKTTLLRLLNGIFWPDKGKITIRGRTGALIAVGTGFHPLLTGRENIYVNGAILGMSRREIDGFYDAIVEFADIGDFLESPVKYYSSGMFVRLGFSVMMFCQPEIMLIDEVLSVGDLSFQNKCLKRLKVLREGGEAVVFVSHNLDHVLYLTDRCMVLDKGQCVTIDKPMEAIGRYEQMIYGQQKDKALETNFRLRRSTREVSFSAIRILNSNGDVTSEVQSGEEFTIEVEMDSTRIIEQPNFAIAILNDANVQCIWNVSRENGLVLESLPPKSRLRVTLKGPKLAKGFYQINFALRDASSLETIERFYNLTSFVVNSPGVSRGILKCDCDWELIAKE